LIRISSLIFQLFYRENLRKYNNYKINIGKLGIEVSHTLNFIALDCACDMNERPGAHDLRDSEIAQLVLYIRDANTPDRCEVQRM